MTDRNTQVKIVFVSFLLSAVVACICLYAKPQGQGYAVVKASPVVRTAGN